MPKNNKDITARECTRIPKEIQIEIKKVEYPLSNKSEEDGISKDIAKQGICFTTPTQYEPGKMLSLNMKINGWHRHRKGLKTILSNELSETDILTVIAEVVWTKASADGNDYDIGVKFINVYEDDMIALEKYFSSMLTDD
ncbi:MAG: PilZ domain-containing protein [Gammaproteobacteria bacterium]|nr:PilZ domain-containing protein [Gammaproteobacteria bacterium]MCK5262304.1 PilZ domain-containing protein [Gammaproteobacteria bacterium]